MGLSNYTLSSPPRRYSLWNLFNEAWGYFTGGIGMGDISLTVKLLESQIHFYEGGHNHNATTNAGGKPLVVTSLLKKHFNLQGLDVVWGNYYASGISGGYLFIVLSGSGTCQLASTTTGLVYGTVLMDYNPYITTWATTQACQLDLRFLNAYNSASPFNSNWTLVHAYLCPIYATTIDRYLVNQAWGFDTGASNAPYFRMVAKTTGTGTLTFDYKVVLQKL